MAKDIPNHISASGKGINSLDCNAPIAMHTCHAKSWWCYYIIVVVCAFAFGSMLGLHTYYRNNVLAYLARCPYRWRRVKRFFLISR